MISIKLSLRSHFYVSTIDVEPIRIMFTLRLTNQSNNNTPYLQTTQHIGIPKTTTKNQSNNWTTILTSPRAIKHDCSKSNTPLIFLLHLHTNVLDLRKMASKCQTFSHKSWLLCTWLSNSDNLIDLVCFFSKKARLNLNN